jgi:hypothetical protein
MDANDLHKHALDELKRRLGLARPYSLDGQDGSRITVHAALIDTDQFKIIESNPANRKTLSLAADAAADDGRLFPWLDAMDGKPSLLTLAQVRSLDDNLIAFRTAMYGFLHRVYGEINGGAITTPEQVDQAAWPS